MRINELRSHVYDIIAEYFAGAAVIWAENKYVKPNLPFITLKMDNLSYAQHYITESDTDVSTNCKPSKIRLEVQLFTQGQEVEDEDGDTYYENTAINDMADFLSYIDSDYVLNICDGLDISITTEGDIQDVSALLNDTQYEFRAMQEFFVTFLQTSQGFAGIGREHWEQTASGGGTERLASMQTGTIERVEIKEEIEN